MIVVDHGSKRAESNLMLERFVEQFSDLFHGDAGYDIVEPAHMELAEPSIPTAYARCVERGARVVVVCPYFLLPGKHWHQDIPAITASAARQHPGTSFLVTAPIGLHPLMAQVIRSRIETCVAHAGSSGPVCDVCEGTAGCALASGS